MDLLEVDDKVSDRFPLIVRFTLDLVLFLGQSYHLHLYPIQGYNNKIKFQIIQLILIFASVIGLFGIKYRKRLAISFWILSCLFDAYLCKGVLFSTSRKGTELLQTICLVKILADIAGFFKGSLLIFGFYFIPFLNDFRNHYGFGL